VRIGSAPIPQVRHGVAGLGCQWRASAIVGLVGLILTQLTQCSVAQAEGESPEGAALTWEVGGGAVYTSHTVRFDDSWRGALPAEGHGIEHGLRWLLVKEVFHCLSVDDGRPTSAYCHFPEWVAQDGAIDASLQGALVRLDGGTATFELADNRPVSALAQRWLESRARQIDPFRNALQRACALEARPTTEPSGSRDGSHVANIIGMQRFAEHRAQSTPVVESSDRARGWRTRGALFRVSLPGLGEAPWLIGGDYAYDASFAVHAGAGRRQENGTLFGELQGAVETNAGPVCVVSQVSHTLDVRSVPRGSLALDRAWSRAKRLLAVRAEGLVPVAVQPPGQSRSILLAAVARGEGRIAAPEWIRQDAWSPRTLVDRVGVPLEPASREVSTVGSEWCVAIGELQRLPGTSWRPPSDSASGFGGDLILGWRPDGNGTWERRIWLTPNKLDGDAIGRGFLLGHCACDVEAGPWLVVDVRAARVGWSTGSVLTSSAACIYDWGAQERAPTGDLDSACGRWAPGAFVVPSTDPMVFWQGRGASGVDAPVVQPEGATASEAFSHCVAALAGGGLRAATLGMRALRLREGAFAALLDRLGPAIAGGATLGRESGGDVRLLARWQALATTMDLPQLGRLPELVVALLSAGAHAPAIAVRSATPLDGGAGRAVSLAAVAFLTARGAFEDALLFLGAVGADPADTVAVLARVDVLFGLQRWREGLDLLAVLPPDPTSVPVLERSAYGNIRVGEHGHAARAARALLALQAGRPKGFRYLAAAAVGEGAVHEALRVVEEGVQEFPASVELRTAAVEAYIAAGEKPGAARHLAVLARLDAEAARALRPSVEGMFE
jgi:hypothetical protein